METQPMKHPEDPGITHVLDEIVDLEEYASRGEAPPLAKGYRLKINGKKFVISDPNPTGKEILTLANLLPAKDYTLRLKAAGSAPKKIGLDDEVHLCAPGIEKFKALPRDQTEG